jgi:hypothetical protein
MRFRYQIQTGGKAEDAVAVKEDILNFWKDVSNDVPGCKVDNFGSR